MMNLLSQFLTFKELNTKNFRIMNNLEIIKVYKRYRNEELPHTKDIVSLYDSMEKWLERKVEDEKLKSAIHLGIINETLKESSRRKLNFKDGAVEWNSSILPSFYNLTDKVSKANMNDYDNTQFKVFTCQLFKLITEEESPHTRLYMWSVCKEKLYMGMFRDSSAICSKLAKCNSEEEVQNVLS